MQGRIAVVVKGYPRLSETFIAQELLGLERAGLDLLIVSLRHPTDHACHPIHREIRAPVLYLPEYLHVEPLRVLRGLWAAVSGRRLWSVLPDFARDVWRDRTRNRLRRLGQALVLARELPSTVSCLYVHYLHTPSSVARYTAKLCGLPYAISAHAKDIWTIPDWEIREKLMDAAWLTTCTEQAHRHLNRLVPEARVLCLPHGVDLGRFPAPCWKLHDRMRSQSEPIELVTVARAVEKKGLDILLQALAALPREIAWRWRHIGGGPLLPQLQQAAAALGIADRISWCGALPFDEVLAALRRADVFCFSPRVAADGDRDGIPNVVAEAMAMGLPVVSSRAGAVDEIVENGRTGILVPSEDPLSLASALVDLMCDPERRAAMGRAGRSVIESRFVAGPGIVEIGRELAELASGAEPA
jgi:glycosyltransferase involved in cell wall biosynthesis